MSLHASLQRYSASSHQLLFLAAQSHLNAFGLLVSIDRSKSAPVQAREPDVAAEVYRPQSQINSQINALLATCWNDLESHAIKPYLNEFHPPASVQAHRNWGTGSSAAMCAHTSRKTSDAALNPFCIDHDRIHNTRSHRDGPLGRL